MNDIRHAETFRSLDVFVRSCRALLLRNDRRVLTSYSETHCRYVLINTNPGAVANHDTFSLRHRVLMATRDGRVDLEAEICDLLCISASVCRLSRVIASNIGVFFHLALEESTLRLMRDTRAPKLCKRSSRTFTRIFP